MNLESWGFPEFSLLETEKVVLSLGRRTGMNVLPSPDKELMLLTSQRIVHLAQRRRLSHVHVVGIEEVTGIELRPEGKNIGTFLIGIIGILVGLLVWLFIPSISNLIPIVGFVVVVAGSILALLVLVSPEKGVLLLQAGPTQIRIEVSGDIGVQDIAEFMNRMYIIKERRRIQRSGLNNRWKRNIYRPKRLM
jgi:hypothetical protein